MNDERNRDQIIRKDARGCFVESLSDAFGIGKVHIAFAAYDMKRPSGQRQTDCVHIYMDVGELLELCREAESGELRAMLREKRQSGERGAIYQHLGGTPAERLASLDRARPDGTPMNCSAPLRGRKRTFCCMQPPLAPYPSHLSTRGWTIKTSNHLEEDCHGNHR